MVVGIDQPGEERPTVEVVLDRAGMVAANLRCGTDTQHGRAADRACLGPRDAAGSR